MNDTLTKKEINYLNKYLKEIRAKREARALEIIKEYESGKIWGCLNPRDLLKRLEIKTRHLKRDNSNYKELILNHYIERAERTKNDILNLINNDEISTVKSCEARTTWNRSRIWGWNPTCEVFINNILAGTGSASGCGYDKQSSAINSAIYNNDIFKKSVILKAIKTLSKGEALPYGVRADEFGISASFGGCGVGTFTNILKWLGCENVKRAGRDDELIFTY